LKKSFLTPRPVEIANDEHGKIKEPVETGPLSKIELRKTSRSVKITLQLVFIWCKVTIIKRPSHFFFLKRATAYVSTVLHI